jgi:hypothetical protein
MWRPFGALGVPAGLYSRATAEMDELLDYLL